MLGVLPAMTYHQLPSHRLRDLLMLVAFIVLGWIIVGAIVYGVLELVAG